MPLSMRTAVEPSPEPETKTAAQGSYPLNSGQDERAFAGTFSHNVTAGRRFTSRLKLQPIWTDDHCFAGWLTSGEAAGLSEWRCT
jgi:hypothetical protein